MVIVYLSIALAVAALVYLGISGFRTFKTMQPTLKSFSHTMLKMQKQMEGISKETNRLKKNANGIKQDIQLKKQTVQDMVVNAKWTIEEIKSFWKIASMAPNPKKLEDVQISPEIRRIENRLLDLWERWRKW